VSGASRMIVQRDLSSEKLAEEIGKLVRAPHLVSEMEVASKKLARGDAARAAVDMLEELARKRK
jgi:UDP-N-acetylglucosamine:LPS N-acetylglucosamine transferase